MPVFPLDQLQVVGRGDTTPSTHDEKLLMHLK